MTELAKNLPKTLSVTGTSFCIAQVALPADELRLLADEIALFLPSGVIAIACQDATKVHFFIKVSEDLIAKGVKASELLQAVLPTIEGNGGGKNDSAQGAGKAKDRLPQALELLTSLVLN